MPISFALANGGQESRVSIESEQQGMFEAGKISYQFKLFDSESNKAIQNSDLKETHTKILHLMVFDTSLNEFNHVHPEFNQDLWTVDLNLPRNGIYFIWAQGQLTDGTEFSTFTKTELMNGLPALTPVPLGDHRTNSVGNTTIQLANTKIRAGKMAMINFTVSRTDGQLPELTPYLGAFAHVIATPMDGDELIHVHPQEGSKPNTGMLHATFPSEGDYRLWVQLVDHGELKTIPISVTVLK
jgi:hypothetical protein